MKLRVKFFVWRNGYASIRMVAMSKRNIAVNIDIRTLEGLLDDLRDLHSRLDRELSQLESSPRLSEAYLDHLSEIYTLMTWVKGLAPDLQTEIDRLDDQLPQGLEPFSIRRGFRLPAARCKASPRRISSVSAYLGKGPRYEVSN